MSPEPGDGFWGFSVRRNMAKQSQNKFIKRQKELERMRKAKEKMARRQGQKDRTTESDGSRIFQQPHETSNQ